MRQGSISRSEFLSSASCKDLIDKHRDDIDGFKGTAYLKVRQCTPKVFCSLGVSSAALLLHIYFNGQQQEDRLRFDQYITDLYLELTEGPIVEEHAEA